MWQRYTERARRVILLGQEEAGKMNSSHVGTEHLLLGLIRHPDCSGARVLQQMSVSLDGVREQVVAQMAPATQAFGGEPKLTPKAKRVLELAADEARRLRHNYIGTEHLLLALLREKDGLAATVLRQLNLNLEKVRSQVTEYLDDTNAPIAATAAANESVAQFRVAPAVRDALNLAMQESREVGADQIEIAQLLRALCQPGSEGARCLEGLGVDVPKLYASLRGARSD